MHNVGSPPPCLVCPGTRLLGTPGRDSNISSFLALIQDHHTMYQHTAVLSPTTWAGICYRNNVKNKISTYKLVIFLATTLVKMDLLVYLVVAFGNHWQQYKYIYIYFFVTLHPRKLVFSTLQVTKDSTTLSGLPVYIFPHTRFKELPSSRRYWCWTTIPNLWPRAGLHLPERGKKEGSLQTMNTLVISNKSPHSLSGKLLSHFCMNNFWLSCRCKIFWRD